MPYDPTLFQGTAAHYAHGRPPYSRGLVPALVGELDLDGAGRLLDIGCGPGTLVLALADRFAEAVGLDPDPQMLAEAARRDSSAKIRWVQALAEEIEGLELGRFRLVTFGQSFHWTDRERVAELVYDLLEPGGALALVTHTDKGRPRPAGPGYPPIPHAEIEAILERHVGAPRRPWQGQEPAEAVLARTRFGAPRSLYCTGRPDIVQDSDGILANYLSMSFASPHRLGDRLPAFEAEVRAALQAASAEGLFWDWPGDTRIVLATRPG